MQYSDGLMEEIELKWKRSFVGKGGKQNDKRRLYQRD